MNEFSECVYIRSSQRDSGVEWLRDNELAGHVLPPAKGWVRVYPRWDHISDEKTTALLENSSGLVVYCYYADQQYWAFSIFEGGKLRLRYECIWLVEEYAVDGEDPADVAELLEVDPQRFESVFRSGDTNPSWQELVDDARRFAELLELPDQIWTGLEEAGADSGHTELQSYLVGPGAGYETEGMGEDHPTPAKDEIEEGVDAQLATGLDLPDDFGALADVDGQPASPPSDTADSDQQPSPPDAHSDAARGDDAPDPAGGDAPWRAVYELAAEFLRELEVRELLELTVDNELARDRLVERMTNLVIDNPVSRDAQVLDLWFDELMTSPEVVDIFATDAMLEEVFQEAKQKVETATE